MLPHEVVMPGDWIVSTTGDALEIQPRSCYIGAEVRWILADETLAGVYRIYTLEVVK